MKWVVVHILQSRPVSLVGEKVQALQIQLELGMEEDMVIDGTVCFLASVF